MAYIEVVQPENATGKLKDIYDGLLKSRGKIAEVHKILSLNPKAIVAHMDLYMVTMYGKSTLTRAEKEMIAVVVSKANNCDYCQLHHIEALDHYWKDPKKSKSLKEDYNKCELPPRELEMCRYAEELTLRPSTISDTNNIKNLKKVELTDTMIMEIALVVSYFNFVNRLVLGLGVEINAEEINGYEYD